MENVTSVPSVLPTLPLSTILPVSILDDLPIFSMPWLSYTILSLNLIGIACLILAVKLRLVVETILLLTLVIVSSMYHVCVPYSDACLTLDLSAWWYSDFCYSFTIVFIMMFYVVSWENSEYRWSVFFIAQIFSLLGANKNPESLTYMPLGIFLLAFILIIAKVFYSIKKDEMSNIRWRMLLVFVSLFLPIILTQQFVDFDVGHALWHGVVYIGLLLVLLTRFVNERSVSGVIGKKGKRSVMKRTLDEPDSVTASLTYKKQMCLLTCEDKMGKRCSNFLLALMAGDMFVSGTQKTDGVAQLKEDVELTTAI